ITRLAEQIETEARAELAQRLAPVRTAPVSVVRALARDESIEVAGPVLSQSSRLTEEDLVACANGKGQDRLLAISKRASLSEKVSDILVTQGDNELAVSVGMRKDIPKEQFQALVSKASEAVFEKLAAGNPAVAAEVNRVL